MTSFATFAVAAIVSGGPAAACGGPVVPVEVSVVRAPIQERRDFTLEQIEALRRASGKVPTHKLFGLYAVKVFYTIDATPPSSGRCAPIARVDLVLSERVIQLARDIAPGPCLSAAAAHYSMHAAANDTAFTHLAERVTAAFRAPALAASLLAARTAGEIQETIEAALEPEMSAYDHEDLSAQREVDNPAERERLERSCAGPVRH